MFGKRGQGTRLKQKASKDLEEIVWGLRFGQPEMKLHLLALVRFPREKAVLVAQTNESNAASFD